MTAASDGKIVLVKITALSGEAAHHPLWGEHLLNDRAQADAAARNVLTFLSYKEKFLAGSWLTTYFGRDTLMSVRLLMPCWRPVRWTPGECYADPSVAARRSGA